MERERIEQLQAKYKRALEIEEQVEELKGKINKLKRCEHIMFYGDIDNGERLDLLSYNSALYINERKMISKVKTMLINEYQNKIDELLKEIDEL